MAPIGSFNPAILRITGLRSVRNPRGLTKPDKAFRWEKNSSTSNNPLKSLLTVRRKFISFHQNDEIVKFSKFSKICTNDVPPQGLRSIFFSGG